MIRPAVQRMVPQRIALRHLAEDAPSHHPRAHRRAPAMITSWEWAWLHHQARTRGGVMVDLGSCFGGTTIALADGLRCGKHSGSVHAFDLWSWEPWMRQYADLGLAPGDSFLPAFLTNTAPYRDVTVHEGDLLDTTWESPIDLLVSDASKHQPASAHAVRTFVPHLQKWGALLEQDFGHWLNGWTVIYSYRLRRHLRWRSTFPSGCSVVFQMTRPISPELAARATADLGDDREAAAAYRWAKQLVHGRGRAQLDVSRALLPFHRDPTLDPNELLHQIDPSLSGWDEAASHSWG